MELRFRNWNDISINTFNRLMQIKTNGDDLDMLDNNIQLLSILCDVNEDEILQLTTIEFAELLSQTTFLKDMPKAKIKDTYIINGKTYNVFLSLRDMSVAQYIDFQTYYKDRDKYLKELLSIFLIPKGKKYCDGYNIADVINDIGEHLSIVDAHSIMFFFALLFRTLTKVMMGYSIKEVKKMKKKTKKQEEINKMEQAIKEMEKITHLVQNGVGYIW